MTIKAMVDGEERFVELNPNQMSSAYEKLQHHYDMDDLDNNLDAFLDFVECDDEHYDDMIAYIDYHKDVIIDTYRATLDSNSDEWYFTMRNTVEGYAKSYLDRITK